MRRCSSCRQIIFYGLVSCTPCFCTVSSPPDALVALQLMMPAESAHDTVAVLGEVGLLQFKDLNSDKSAFQRTFANQVRIVDFLCSKF